MPTLLCADDAPDIRTLVRAVLAREGMTVVPVADGEAALAALETCQPDALLVDLEMPGIGGLETVRRVRADARFSALPIAVLSGHSEPEQVAAALAAGADAVVAKPFEPAVLRARVAALLDRPRRAEGPAAASSRGQVRPPGPASTGSGAADEVADLRAQFRGTTERRVAVLEEAIADLLAGSLTPELRERAAREAHKLAGSLGTFGAPEGSAAARELELALGAPGPIPAESIPRLAEAVVVLRPALDRAHPRDAPQQRHPTASPRLLVVGGDRGPEIAVAAAERGYDVTHSPAVSAARTALAGPTPAVIVVEISAAEAAEVVAFAGEVTDRPAPARVVAVARREETVDRLALARAGVAVVLADTPSVDDVLDAIDALVAGDRGRQPLVLLVDDDPVLLGLARGFLEAADLRVETLTEPARFTEVLTRTRPDAVVLDVDMPGVDGVDLCRVIRADPAWRALPVLFLTAHTEPATVHRVFAAGADDFVAKPIVGPELTARIRNRLERAQLLTTMANTDPISELPTRPAILRDLARMLADTSRTGQPFAVGILDLEGVAAANEARGYDAGDALLRSTAARLVQEIRGAGVVGRWVSDRFVVGLPGLTAAQAAQRLVELEPGQPDDGSAASFAAGVAAFPGDGRDVAELARSADRACSFAQTRGHAQVVCCDAAAAIDDGAPDVLIVDDDEALAGLLLHTLRGRGYHVRWLADGPTAAAALLGASPTLRPRSIVLDVNLPGLSGLDLLRALHSAGVTRRSRVVMLTGRAAEAEVVEALELGAFDHVAKPFSVPVLVQRLRRALEA